MPHKLLIEFDIEYQSQFSPFLKALEIVRGEEFRLNLFATNLGKSQFPGGDVTKLTIELRPHGQGGAMWASSSKIWCPEIEAGGRVRFYSDIVFALDEGIAWIHVKVQAKDGEAVEYYQTATDLITVGDDWMNWFYVVSSENIQIIALLDKIVKRLGSRFR